MFISSIIFVKHITRPSYLYVDIGAGFLQFDMFCAIDDVQQSNMCILLDGYWKDRFTTLKLVSCQNCMSVGDAIREVDARSLITSDFLLITNPATICTSDLRPQIKAYR
uniref:Uncharacterized protein n=1 Tax=Ascaris lumbricoides TaxID=6252 RepID=A0A0M3HGV0_ASCLU